MHVDSVIALTLLEYAPAVQEVHAAVPVVAENVPAAQSEQLIWPESEYVPTGQLEQAADTDAPEIAEYKPARQFTQLQLDVALIPVEYVPAPQLLQLELPVAPP